MEQGDFERLVAEEFPNAVPLRFQEHIENVALLIEDEPSPALRREEGLGPHETLLGHYRGISLDRRGLLYGVGPTLPDTITLYRLPILQEAERQGGGEASVRSVVRDTIWHEVAHYFGFAEHEVRKREDEGTNHSHTNT